ncbi:MAG: multidrug MFS transporter [Rhodobacterales bacterium]|nr:MAG: multidrug MFS transporter [Rhodobacterales bacterium]
MPNRLSYAEFVALMAMMFSTIAFSIDSMLPALPEIGAELSPADPNRAQLILTSFVIGMGLGTFVAGPLSDTFGRKPVILWGATVYIAAAALAWFAPTLELVLLARVIQGLGIAGPRIVSMAIIRDMYEGREMARLMSIVMLIFTLVPAIAPAMGALIIDFSGWRSVFIAFILFALVGALWMGLRQPETLPRAARRPFQASKIRNALLEMMRIPSVRISISVQTLCYAILFGMLSSVQPVYDQSFGRGESFHLWFGLVAVISGTASVINAMLVVRLGMRRLVTAALFSQLVISAAVILWENAGLGMDLRFGLFVFWQTSVFFMVGMTLGNLNAMGMEPLGHIAGLAASMIAGTATVVAMVFAIPLGLAFDGTPLPLAIGICGLSCVAVLLMLWLKQVEAWG